jgi:biotin carboxylase
MSAGGSPRHFVFVESNTTGTGRLVVEQIAGEGHFVTFLARRPEIYPFLRELPAVEVRTLETNDLAALDAGVRAVAAGRPLDVLVTFSDYYVPLVAEVAARHGLRYLAPDAARACRNKIATRRALRAAGLPVPDFWILSSRAEALGIARSLPYPCVVKSPFEGSSKGVLQVGDAAELLAHFDTLHGWKANARGQALSGEVLVESLLQGPEFSVETVTLGAGRTHVAGVTTKYLSAPPLFVEIGHDFPCARPAATPADIAALAAAACAALAAVGFDFGPAHTELRLTPSGPVVVEINPRLAGGMIPELVRLATGVDLLAAFLSQLAGEEPVLAPSRAEHAAIRFLIAPAEGTLAGVEGLEAARRLPAVREVAIAKPLGARVRPAEEATDRVGYVIAAGPDRREVRDQVEQAHRLIRLAVEPAAS